MYSELFSPLQIGNLTLKNRITQAPIYTGYADGDGIVSQSILDHYAKGSRGGAALAVVEGTSVSASGNGLKNGIRAYEDKHIPCLSKLARGIRDNGALACIQLFHAGRYALYSSPLSASAIPFSPAPGVTVTPKEMTIEEIKEVIGDFASAARRVKQAGFDMLELHGATGYLIVQFLSPLTNKRTDQYGGDLENRLRFSLEVVDAVKKAVGTDFPIGMRFLADDLLPGGYGLEDARVS
ncbi:MAG: NADH:flavin oxidoreductase, partial [Syntrophales bacterium]|nr:NADH:flavin oxidoreductase [Syntrophales bacterium]